MHFLRQIHLPIMFCTISVFVICYSLADSNIFPLSIRQIWENLTDYAHGSPLMAVGLLPFYVAIMIFGIARFSIYLGQWFKYFLNKK